MLEVTGTMQLCAGQTVVIDAGIHAVRWLFESPDSDTALLVDASS